MSEKVLVTRQIAAIDDFVTALRSGDWPSMEEHYAPDAILAAHVPYWYFALRGAGDIISQLTEWFPELAQLMDLHVVEAGDGFVVEFERRRIRSDGGGALHLDDGHRQMHRFRLERGRITEQRIYCIGHMDAETFADIESRALSITAYEF